MASPMVVFVPGLRDHVPQHWQTLLQERLPGSVCVPRLGKTVVSLPAWVEALDATIDSVVGPVVLVAHSAGVPITVHWARGHAADVVGALLATPPDLDVPLPAGYPTRETLAQNGWMPVPEMSLPFRSTVVASTNDSLAAFDRVERFARLWKSAFFNAGAVGHLNPASGFGEWPQAIELLRTFDVEVAATAAR